MLWTMFAQLLDIVVNKIMTRIIAQPWLGGAVREKPQEARPPLERIVEFSHGKNEETRVYTSGTSCVWDYIRWYSWI